MAADKTPVLAEITAINNKTNKEYILKSTTTYGMTFYYNKEIPGLLVINNIMSIGKTPQEAVTRGMARLLDFSIINLKFKDAKQPK